MEDIRKFLNNLSIKGEARAIKVGIATLIAVYISSKFSYMDATTSSITIYLVYAMFFTVSGARKYAKTRIISNVYALIISLAIGLIFRWNLYALALVFYLIMIAYFKFNLENKISLMSSGIAAMTFYVGVGNEVKILHRFISIIIGFIIAIATNELILPTDNGLIVKNNIRKVTKIILNIKASIIENGKLDEVNCKELLSLVETIDTNISLLEKEIKSKPFRNHLKAYKGKLELFKLLRDLSKNAYFLIEYLYESRETFNNIEKPEKLYIMEVMRNLYENHKVLIDQVISGKSDSNEKIKLIKYDKITLDNKFNIILISKFLEYRDSILKLDKYLN